MPSLPTGLSGSPFARLRDRDLVPGMVPLSLVRVLTEPWRLDRGELLVEIGVAPAEPLEFILVRLRREGDGTLNLES